MELGLAARRRLIATVRRRNCCLRRPMSHRCFRPLHRTNRLSLNRCHPMTRRCLNRRRMNLSLRRSNHRWSRRHRHRKICLRHHRNCYRRRSMIRRLMSRHRFRLLHRTNRLNRSRHQNCRRSFRHCCHRLSCRRRNFRPRRRYRRQNCYSRPVLVDRRTSQIPPFAR